jgi:hypothetical protein
MNTIKHIVILLGCMALGISALGCAKLNPNTEGQIYSALEAKKGEFQKCYESALNKDRETKGVMRLKLNFDPDATAPKDASVVKTQINNTEMQSCVANAANGITIQEAPGVFVEGYYNLNFTFK